jgi:hypothetical protein
VGHGRPRGHRRGWHQRLLDERGGWPDHEDIDWQADGADESVYGLVASARHRGERDQRVLELRRRYGKGLSLASGLTNQAPRPSRWLPSAGRARHRRECHERLLDRLRGARALRDEGADRRGTPITLATLPAGQWFTNENVPLGLAVDSTSVHWLTSSTGADSGPGTGSITKVAK